MSYLFDQGVIDYILRISLQQADETIDGEVPGIEAIIKNKALSFLHLGQKSIAYIARLDRCPL